MAANSENFDVRSYRGGPSATEFARTCDALRDHCLQAWTPKADGASWRPRCVVVLHPTRAAYRQAVGRGSERTSGSSLVRFEGERVVLRRVDLLTADDGTAPALAHELTHVVLADRFGPRRPPLWLDEGIATLADAADKQSLHDRDCRQALRRGSSLRLADLLRLDEFSSADQVPAFYGQSLALVRFLAERGEPARIIDFAAAADEMGHDRALKKYYAIDGVADLERQWREYAATSRRQRPDSPVIPASLRRQRVAPPASL